MNSFCAHYNQSRCRSCQWIEFPYSEQLARKEALLRSALALEASFKLEASVTSELKGFRNRAKLSVSGSLEKPVIGLLGEDKLDDGRELLDCPIHHPELNGVISSLPKWIQDYRLTPYRISERKGELKGFILFYSPDSEELYLRFVLRSRECVSRLVKMLPHFQKSHPKVTCVTANIQPIPHALLEGKEEIFITEKKWIRHRLGPLDFSLAPQAFVQTHSALAVRLYETAAQWISESRPARAMELYCGQGAFSFFGRSAADSWLGIEINSQAVEQAQRMAKELGLAHLRFECADATEVSKKIQSEAPHLILVNPPRRGLGAEGVSQLLHSDARRVIYSSCSWQSLSEDLRNLQSHYQLKRAQIFDLFPHTSHFETLVELVRV